MPPDRPRSYFLRPGERSWHAHDGADESNWRALCGRWPTRFSQYADDLPEGMRLCALCREVARITDRADAELAADEAAIAESRRE